MSTQLEGRDEPTDAQKEAENYQKAHVSVLGLEISVETEKGAQRTGKDKDGGEWSVTMPATTATSRARVAPTRTIWIFSLDRSRTMAVYIVNQNQPDSDKFDEHKVMLGYDSGVGPCRLPAVVLGRLRRPGLRLHRRPVLARRVQGHAARSGEAQAVKAKERRGGGCEASVGCHNGVRIYPASAMWPASGRMGSRIC